MTLDVYVVSAFSKNGRGGNRAGVALPGGPLPEHAKIKIAHQLGYSETAFLSRSEQADFKLEYFTPTGEVVLCGHATIATFVLLNHLKLLNKAAYTIETKSGVLNMTADRDGFVYMEQNLPEFYEVLQKTDLGDCFQSAESDDALPIQIVSTGLKDILLPIKSPSVLESMTPDFSGISRISKERDCIGIHAFSLVKDGELTAVCRNFAPLYGINEEAATGTSNCALACYLFQYGFQQKQYIFEQGHHLKSVSRISVRVEAEEGRITGVFAGGGGYVMEKKRLSIC